MKKSNWNKVTPLSKSIALVLFVILPFVGLYYGIQLGKTIALIETVPNSVTVTTPSGNSYYNNVATWQTDQRPDAGFTISYPIDFDTQDIMSVAPTTDWRVGGNGTPGIKYFVLTIPRDFEPQTNFADATLTVGASTNDQAIANCLLPDQTGEPGIATSTVMINGNQFTVFHSSDAGAGNLYETTSYRTLHAGECYAVEYTIHSGQIANYPTSYELQPFSEAPLTSVLDRIVGTFTFL